MKELWSYIVVELLKSIETEHNNDVLGEELHSLGKCIEILGMGCLTQEQMNEVVKVSKMCSVENGLSRPEFSQFHLHGSMWTMSME